MLNTSTMLLNKSTSYLSYFSYLIFLLRFLLQTKQNIKIIYVDKIFIMTPHP